MSILERAVSREVLAEHDGRSGAMLERVVLDDGTQLIVKSADPTNDLTMVTSGNVDRELRLFKSGAFDRLGDGVGHPIVDVWRDGSTVVTVMRDLGDTIPGWTRVISREEVGRVMAALGSMHTTFLDDVPDDLCPLETRLALLGRSSMASVPTGIGGNLPAAILHGWDCFESFAPSDIAAAVFAIHEDPEPLAKAFRATSPLTMCHGDIWLVNLAIEPEQVVLLDWAIATAAPPALDLSIFLTGAAANMACSRADAIDEFVRRSPTTSTDGVACAMLYGLVEMGWNKALDATEHEDAAMRAREQEDLDWWIARARETLELGLL